MSGIELPLTAIRSGIAEALGLIVHIERRRGQRFVSEALALKRYIAGEDRFEFQTVFRSE